MGADGPRPRPRRRRGPGLKLGWNPVTPTELRKRIAVYLRNHGPTWGEPLAGAIGVSLEEFWDAIDCRWFHNVVGGWDLTALGRQEAFATDAGAE